METSIFQTLLNKQLNLWSVVGSGRIANSSKLLCMSSLPVSMNNREKVVTPFFSPSNNTIGCHGNQSSDLAEFRSHPSSHVCYDYSQV